MRRTPIHAATAAAALAAAAMLAIPPAAAAERAGQTVRVQQLSYQKTGAIPATLNRGDTIYRDASVYTRATGSLRLLFDDGTDLTLGPDTDVVIDDYVYAPAGGGARAAFTLGRGVLRMVSGRLPAAAVSVATPVATVGIRGTDFTLDTLSVPGVLRGWVDDGTVTVTPSASTQGFAYSTGQNFICTAAGCQRTGRLARPPFFAAAPSGPGRSPDGQDGGGSGGGPGRN